VLGIVLNVTQYNIESISPVSY